MFDYVKDDKDFDQNRFRSKIDKWEKSDVHQDSYQLCAKVALDIKTIELY